MQRVKQRVSVLDILNLHMSSNSYKRWNLRLQPHSTKQLLLLHNYNIQNESLSQQAIYTFWCWTSFQKGLLPDRPTQPETWRSSEALQECKKNQQQIVPLQLEVKVGCRRGCAQHVLRLCLRKSWPSCRSSKRTFQRICGNRFWFWFRLHVWYRIEGVNACRFPQNGPSQSQHKYLERKPLNCRSIILVHTHVYYQVLHIFWSQAWRQSSCFESLPTPHPNFHLKMLDPRLLSILLISFWLALLFAQLHLHCTSR